MDSLKAELAGEHACQRLVTRFFRALDAGDAWAVAELFTPDGVWRRQGEDVKGHDAIRAGVLERKPNVVIRHMVSNIDVQLIGDNQAAGLSYYALYRRELAEDEAAPFAVAGPVRAGENIHRFVCVQGEWKLAFNQARPIFAIKQA